MRVCSRYYLTAHACRLGCMYAFLSMNLSTCLFIYSICTLAHRNTAPENGTAIRLPQRLLHLQSTFVITFAYMMVWYLWYRTYYVGTMWNLSAFSVLVTTHNIWTRDREDFPLTAHDVRTVSLPMAASTAFGALSAVLLQWLPQDIGSRALEACDDRLQ